ncbi:MAG: type II secretion system F family protein [Actinomycetota bacterium]|nr:type II secretion system F family protein [Actinomycetota bacterium]
MDALALLGLFAVLLVALAGMWLVVSGGLQQARLGERTAVSAVDSRTPLRLRLDDALRSTRRGAQLSTSLSSAGVTLRPIDFVAAALGVGILTALLVSFLFPLWLSIIAGAIAVRSTGAWVDWQREKRKQAFVAQLPQIARILSNGAGAGLSLAGALALAARELDEPARSELGRALEEMHLGEPLSEAMLKLEQRLPSRELGVLVTTLVIQQRLGGDVVRALQDMAETLDSRSDLIREIRTVVSGTVFTAWLVAGLGVGSLLMVNTLNPGVLDKMASDPIGIAALAVSGLLYGLAFVLVRRTVRIDV